MKKILFILVLFQTVLFVGCKTKERTPQQQAKATEYAEKIESQNFTFTPTSAQPMRGRSINLSSIYSLKVSKDTISAYLPFFGRSQIAPSDPTNIGINFVSTDFDYAINEKKNGVYEIKIAPKDLQKREDMGIVLYLNISDSGYGSLDVQSTSRDNISFYGTFE